MGKTKLNYKLEHIEHSYFCFEKDCPVCDGYNYYLTKNFKKRDKIQIPSIKEILADKKKVELGEIWKIKTQSIYPIYVMPVENFGYFYRCIRVSEFTEFKGEEDIVWNDWLLECWNSFPVLKYRFETVIEKINEDILKKILDVYYQAELNEDKKLNNVLIEHFREIELEYQNETFLEEDEPLLIETYNKVEEAEFSLEKLINNLKEKFKKLSINIENLNPIPVPLAAADKNYYRTNIDSAKVLIDDSNLYILYNFIEKDGNKFIRLYIESFFNSEILKIDILRDNNPFQFELLYKDIENIYLDIPYKSGNYQMILYFGNNLKLPINFSIQ